MFLMAFGPGDGCRSDTGSKTVPGQIFASINFRGLGVHSRENLYTAKTSALLYSICMISSSATDNIMMCIILFGFM